MFLLLQNNYYSTLQNFLNSFFFLVPSLTNDAPSRFRLFSQLPLPGADPGNSERRGRGNCGESANSDENEIALYTIATCSTIQVMRIKEVITIKDESS